MQENRDVFWEPVKPILTVERAGGAQLGNCYHGETFRITSQSALDVEEIAALRKSGFLGGGQDFRILGQLMPDGRLHPVPAQWPHKVDWRNWEARQKHPESGADEVGPTVRDRVTREKLDEEPVNRYTGQPITNKVKFRFYVYLVEARTDSSD